MSKVLTVDDFDESFLLEFAINEPEEFKFWFDEKTMRNPVRIPRKFVAFKPLVAPYQRLLPYNGHYYVAIDEYEAFYDFLHLFDFSTVQKRDTMALIVKEILNGTPYDRINPAPNGSSFTGSYNVF